MKLKIDYRYFRESINPHLQTLPVLMKLPIITRGADNRSDALRTNRPTFHRIVWFLVRYTVLNNESWQRNESQNYMIIIMFHQTESETKIGLSFCCWFSEGGKGHRSSGLEGNPQGWGL